MATRYEMSEAEVKALVSKCIVGDAVALGLMQLLESKGIAEDDVHRAVNSSVNMLTDGAMDFLIDRYIEDLRKEMKGSA